MELLTNSTRKNRERVSVLLDDAFREFGSSRRVHTKQDLLLTLQEEAPVSISAVEFEVILLSEGVALVTYKSVKQLQGAPAESALRSSLWVRVDDRWSMIFHQGTKVS